ncbi:hypothetical protein KY289_020737 [Solanum tuberosum]|nr:hypothetical protein KY289_020737 [Solanum tuberosum]
MSSIVLCLWGMSGFTFITLKLYHGGALLYESEEARYVGGLVSEYVDVDVDTISYFEIKDYIKELGYSPNCKFSIRPPNSCILGDIDNDDILLAMCNCLQNGAVLEVYVHMLEEESGAAFNKVGTTENRASENIEYNEVGEAAFNGVDVSLNTTSNIPSTSNTTAPYTDPSDSEDSDYSVAPRTTAPPTTSRTPRHEASASASASASRAAPRTTTPPTTSRTPTDEASASVSGAGVSSRAWSGRGRGRGLGSAARGSTTQGVDQNTNVAPKETATARKGKGVGNTTQFKRPRPGLPSSRILAGPKRVLRSNVVTGDVGFKPTSGLKWKGNQAITTRRLQQIRDQSRLSNPNASSSSQPRDPWKL